MLMQFQEIISFPLHVQISVCRLSWTGNVTSPEKLKKKLKLYQKILPVYHVAGCNFFCAMVTQ